MIKIYLSRFLQSGLLLMLNLVVSIFASAILFTSLKTVGLSDKGSLLVAFFVLAGLIILGFILYPKSIPQRREAYHTSVLLRWLLPQYRRSKKAEELTKGLEQLSQTLITHEVFLAQLIRDARYQSGSVAFERLITIMGQLSDKVAGERQTFAASQTQLVDRFTDQLQAFSEIMVRENQRLAESQSHLINKLTDQFEEREVQLISYKEHLARLQQQQADILTYYNQREAELQQRIGNLEQILNAKSYRDRGIYLLRLNKHEEALPAFRQATRLDPNDAVAYRELGITLLDLKRHEEALPAFQQSVKIAPNDAIAHRELGITLLDLKRHEEALPQFELATQLDPNDAVTYQKLGITLLDLKRYQEAISAFDKAIDINPKDAVAHKLKEVAFQQLGKTSETWQQYGAAVQYDPNAVLSIPSTIATEALPILMSAYLDAVHNRKGEWVLLSRLGLSLSQLYPNFKATDFAHDLTSLIKQFNDTFEIAKRANGHPQVRLKPS